MSRVVATVTLSPEQRWELRTLVSRRTTAQGLAKWAGVLACADGLQNKQIAKQLNVHPPTVGVWRVE